MRPEERRAFISNHLTLGYLKGDRLVALEPGFKTATYTVDLLTHAEKKIESQTGLTTEAITYYQGSSNMLSSMLQR